MLDPKDGGLLDRSWIQHKVHDRFRRLSRTGNVVSVVLAVDHFLVLTFDLSLLTLVTFNLVRNLLFLTLSLLLLFLGSNNARAGQRVSIELVELNELWPCMKKDWAPRVGLEVLVGQVGGPLSVVQGSAYRGRQRLELAARNRKWLEDDLWLGLSLWLRLMMRK